MTDSADEHTPFLPLAERIADGVPIDPAAELDAAAPESDRAVLQALLDIAAIETAHRTAESSFEQLWTGLNHVPRQWGPLTILERLGQGEFGEVYRAHHNTLAIDVALKLSPAGSDAEGSRMRDEARLLARVQHPNVVRVHDVEQRHGRVGYWMDLVQGQTLESLTRTRGFSPVEAAHVGVALCRALAAVHAVGVLHGDVKAHNVIRQDGTGAILLVDFGSGRDLSDEPVEGADIIGTPVHMAPEVLTGGKRSARSDIYSLGVLLYHLVTNDYPVYASSRAAFIDAHRVGTRKRLRDVRADIPAAFVELVERATAGDPSERYSSAGALEAALVRFISGGELASDTAETANHSARRRKDWLYWCAGAAAAVALAFAAEAISRKSTESERSTADAPRPSGTGADVLLPTETYQIQASFLRSRDSGDDEPLTSDARLRVDDRVHLAIETSAPTFVYVVNEDEAGHAFLLFPLRDGDRVNPLPGGTSLRVPQSFDWKIDSPGKQEHFIVFASPGQVPALEEAFRKLPSPREPLEHRTLELLRGVGSLVPAAPQVGASSRFRDAFTTPLAGRETAKGLWARQLTVASDRR